MSKNHRYNVLYVGIGATLPMFGFYCRYWLTILALFNIKLFVNKFFSLVYTSSSIKIPHFLQEIQKDFASTISLPSCSLAISLCAAATFTSAISLHHSDLCLSHLPPPQPSSVGENIIHATKVCQFTIGIDDNFTNQKYSQYYR